MTALILLFLSFLKLHFKQIQQTTMSRIQQQPHSYRSGNIPLRFIRPLLDHRGVPTKLHTAIGRAPKEIEDCHICLEEIRFGQTRAIATPCCDHYVHLRCFRRWKREQRRKKQNITCTMCRQRWDSTSLCVLCERN
jgi:hypothetical protein